MNATQFTTLSKNEINSLKAPVTLFAKYWGEIGNADVLIGLHLINLEIASRTRCIGNVIEFINTDTRKTVAKIVVNC